MTVITPKQYIDLLTADQHALTVSDTVFDRLTKMTSSPVAVSQTAYFTYFTAKKSIGYNNVRTYTGATGTSGTAPTLCRMAFYNVDVNGSLTTSSSTPNNTSLWNAANTGFTQSLFSTFNAVVGVRYAIMLLCVTTGTPPQWIMADTPASAGHVLIMTKAPRVTGTLTGQTDVPFPGPFSDASLVNGSQSWPIYVELLP